MHPLEGAFTVFTSHRLSRLIACSGLIHRVAHPDLMFPTAGCCSGASDADQPGTSHPETRCPSATDDLRRAPQTVAKLPAPGDGEDLRGRPSIFLTYEPSHRLIYEGLLDYRPPTDEARSEVFELLVGVGSASAVGDMLAHDRTGLKNFRPTPVKETVGASVG
jgi:hypothetical protein